MTKEQINQKYAQLSMLIGDHSFKIRQHKAKLDELFKEIDKLNELMALLPNESEQPKKD